MTCRTLTGDCHRLRIYQYYLPVFFWCRRQLEEHRQQSAAAATPPPPLVVGISAPQGSGKSTLVEELELLFQHCGNTAVGVSIDDFYLTFEVRIYRRTLTPHCCG